MSYIIALLVGLSTVFQGSLNALLAERWGLAGATLLNAIVVIVGAVALYVVVSNGHSDSAVRTGLFSGRVDVSATKWWFIVPGLLGLVIIIGAPWAIAKIGAAPVFITIVGAQVVTSVAWDAIASGSMPSVQRLVGAVLAVGSVYFVRSGG